ncbi:MAG TPA: SDR family NAD(P)-dependent oxidoreductase, partial [Candidatus Acetothermia bacterium]|nr:SDR family NAD(P)-dependent oxidoreductase [Candidatus Acetothermia bacterium]
MAVSLRSHGFLRHRSERICRGSFCCWASSWRSPGGRSAEAKSTWGDEERPASEVVSMEDRPKRALITGSTRGIGWAIAQELAQRGFVPILNYRQDQASAERAKDRLSEICGDVTVVRADVTLESDLKRLMSAVLSQGPLDVLVNSVGEFLYAPFLETARDDWDRILKSNLLATVRACQLAIPAMRAQHSGQIVNIAT